MQILDLQARAAVLTVSDHGMEWQGLDPLEILSGDLGPYWDPSVTQVLMWI